MFENSLSFAKPACPLFDSLHLAETKDLKTTNHLLSVVPGGFWAVSLRATTPTPHKVVVFLNLGNTQGREAGFAYVLKNTPSKYSLMLQQPGQIWPLLD